MSQIVRSLAQRLEKALRIGGRTHDIGDVAAGLQTGRFQWWPRKDSGTVTEIVVYPKGPVLNVFLAAGDLDDVLALVPDMKTFAKAQGCSRITCIGRRGWERVLPKHGWRITGTAFALDLENDQ